MYQSIVDNLKKIAHSIFPIVLIVLILGFSFNIDSNTMIRFLSSSILVMFGLTLFTTGTDISLNIIGEYLGKTLVKKKNLKLILITSLLIGTFITILEPEFLTVSSEAYNIPKYVFLLVISLGVGIFLMFAILRILKKISYKIFLITFYIILLFLFIISDFKIIPYALDMSSVTTGVISAPFILAYGGILASYKKRNKDSEFGFLSICSMGPIFMVLILNLVYKTNILYDAEFILKKLTFLNTFKNNFKEVFISLIPIILIYLIFTYLKKQNKKEIRKIILGLVMVLLGITLFLTGGDVGFYKIAYDLGSNLGNINHLLIIIIGGLLGYFITKLEPSLKVLLNYVDTTTNGGIKSKFLETFLCLGVAISFMISLFRVLNSIDVMVFIIPFYFLAILLAFFTPNNFLGIAFDSAGVIAGNMASTFLLPLLIGVSSTLNLNYLMTAFGTLSLISIIPVIILEIVGIIYNMETKLLDTKQIDDSIINYR